MPAPDRSRRAHRPGAGNDQPDRSKRQGAKPTSRGSARKSTRSWEAANKQGGGVKRRGQAPPRGDDGSTPRTGAKQGAPRSRNGKTGRRAVDEGEAARRSSERPLRRRANSERQERPDSPASKWGGVARRGARALHSDHEGDHGPTASDLWREAVARAGAARRPDPDEPWQPEEQWIEETRADREEPTSRPPAVGPRDLATGKEGIATPGGHRRKVPRPVLDELTAAAGAARGAKLASRISDASYAFQKERYQDARRILKVLVEEAPSAPAVRELYGLVLYRTGQWAAAVKQLEAFRQMTGSFDQHPVLADCYRALRRFGEADAVWEELRDASPSGDLVAEGRIVAAGCRADQGDLHGAVVLLERSARRVARPQDRHLRQWYALADLYERAGDLSRARELFGRVAAADPDAFDVRSRVRALR